MEHVDYVAYWDGGAAFVQRPPRAIVWQPILEPRRAVTIVDTVLVGPSGSDRTDYLVGAIAATARCTVIGTLSYCAKEEEKASARSRRQSLS